MSPVSRLDVRPRLSEDLPALADVLMKVHALDGYPVEGVADPIGWLTPPRTFGAWTAVYGGRPIGQATITRATADDDAARIWHENTGGDLDQLAIPARLFIDPDHRKNGAGGALLSAIRNHAENHGLEVAFDVMLKDRAAIRLYEASGCTRIGLIEHHHGDGKMEPAAVYVVDRPGPRGGRIQ
ncbi:GNAT family N-acetyltransferase [Nocardioides sp. NPDC000445]|uniref:GNAT family N-acetyltransferase n=1 Tax=Nocardioides sp. NPDC000445 TaxID=3154257 RepID=UPI0033286821